MRIPSPLFPVLALALGLAACGGKNGSDTGGSGDGGTVGDGGGGDTTALTCDTSNEDCAPGTCGGEGGTMLPGSQCISCHSPGNYGEDGNAFWSAAGTAFTDWAGSGKVQDLTVRITDSTGTTTTLTTNSAGNFWTTNAMTPPLTAEVEANGTVRAMVATVTTGECNSCHKCGGAAGGKLYTP